MKYLMIAVLFLILSSSKAQEPPKRSTKIIVLVKDSTSILLNTIAKGLFDRGFTIDTKDDNTKTLSTKEFAPDHPSLFIKVRASVNDSGIVFTGTYMWTLTNNLFPTRQEFSSIEYRGMKNSAAMQTWRTLDAIARTFGDNIVYSK